MNLDHVAISTSREKMQETVLWYVEKVNASIMYQDETWALLKTENNQSIALVVQDQHPPHIAFSINEEQKQELVSLGKKFKKHRDDSESVYIKDPSGNFVEFLLWPKKI